MCTLYLFVYLWGVWAAYISTDLKLEWLCAKSSEYKFVGGGG